MAIQPDPARAALVTQAYRYAIIEDPMIRAKFPNATEVVIETNLDAAAGGSLATSTFAQTSSLPHVFSFTVEALFFAEDFIDGAPRYTLSFDKHPATGPQTYTIIKADPSYFNGTSKIWVRG